MAGKKSPKSKKPAKKAAPRKTAKPAIRKAKSAAAPAKAAKPAKTRSLKTAAPVKAPVKAAAPKAAPTPSVLRPRPANPISITQVADARSALAAAQARPARRPGIGDEDDDLATGHNLLLGPRNVRPYRERKGEQYMGREQLEHFRLILNSWKRDLMEEVDRTMNHMKDAAATPPDPNDRATLESEFALELRTRDRERKLIRKIDEAISRIDDGTYGYCNETGEPIGVKRLEARPVATLCIEAQERRERREKQYGDRDDWYR